MGAIRFNKGMWRRALFLIYTALLSGVGQAATYTQPLLLTANYPNANTYYIAYYDFLNAGSSLR